MKYILKVLEICQVISILLATIYSGETVAQTMNVGFVEIPQQLNIITSNHPTASFIRAATTEALTTKLQEAGTQLSYRLQLSDSVGVSSDYRVWSFRIRPLARFSNGAAVTVNDVVFSVNRCVRNDPKVVMLVRERRAKKDSQGEQWVELEIKKAPLDFYNGAELPLWLAQCPIYHKSSSQLFGSDFGLGTNAVSSGDYYIKEFREGKGYHLIALKDKLSSAKHIEIKGFSDPESALTAIRLGVVDLLFFNSEEFVEDPLVLDAIKKALIDETLAVSQCPNYIVILRKGLAFDCQSGIDVSSLYYQK